MLLLLMLTAAAPAAEGNALTNGAFDTGSTQPWNVWGDRTALSLSSPRSPAWNLQIGPTLPADGRAQGGAFQDRPADRAGHATARGWFRAVEAFEGDARAELKLEFLDADSGEPTRVAIAPATALHPDDGWVCRETDAPVPPNTGTVRVAALFFSDTGEAAGLVAVDDLALHLDGSGPPCDPRARVPTAPDTDPAPSDTSGPEDDTHAPAGDVPDDAEGCGCATSGTTAAFRLLGPMLLTRRRGARRPGAPRGAPPPRR